MVAPPDKEKTQEFIHIAQALAPMGLKVPQIYAYEPQQGLALIIRLGRHFVVRHFGCSIGENALYPSNGSIIDPTKIHHPVLPFNHAHATLELSYFPDWCLEQLLGMTLSSAQSRCWMP